MRHWGRARVLAGVAVAAALLAASPTRAQQSAPTVSLDRTGTAAGEVMVVTGGGWPAGSTVLVELCGQGGVRGSADCDVGHQRQAGVGPGGTFSTALTVGLPPAPCPCVVKATGQSGSLTATAAIAVQGIPTVPIDESALDLPERRIEVSSLDISGGSWVEWFGVGAERTLEVTLVNTGEVGIESPAVAIAWGPGDDPTGFVPSPPLDRMEPGDTRSFEVSLPASGVAFGERTAAVEIQGLDEPSAGQASVTTFPWGLLAVGSVGLALAVRAIRDRRRHRSAPRPDEPDQLAEPDEPGGHEDDVIDLRDGAGSPVPAVIDLTDAHPTSRNGFTLVGARAGPGSNGGAPAVGAGGVAPARAAEPVHDPRDGSVVPSELEALEASVQAASDQVGALLLAVEERRRQARERLAADLAFVRAELLALGRRQHELAEAQRNASEAVADVEPAPPRQLDVLDLRLAAALTRALRS